jgi:uncharacterized protein YjbI with pentapeptide repeats
MNRYARKLFGVMFQSKQTQQIVRIQPQHALTSPEEWSTYWQSQGQPWRTEPEIDEKRQKELNQRRAVVPDIKQGIYPFRGMKLSRADVEWLLATHENGRGPVNWSDEGQRGRKGLDLRGADLCQIDLSYLPLARLRGGLTLREWSKANEEQRSAAVVLLKGANLHMAHLEGAYLRKAHLEHANLFRAHLAWTHLDEAHLEHASLIEAYLDKTYLAKVKLSDGKYGGPRIVDAYWGDGNLAVVQWSQIEILGEEYEARQQKSHGKVKNKETRQEEYEIAVRAYRQLTTALQARGLNEDAARFAYRAQILQRKVFWMQREIGRWFFSFLLAILAGYGYRTWRIIVAYLLVVSICAAAYFFIGMYHPPHLTLLQAFLESITAFHGRVFYELFSPETPQIWVTASEAIAGLVIEGVFIAMLTQRFFGK